MATRRQRVTWLDVMSRFRQDEGETRLDTVRRHLAGVREVLCLPVMRRRHPATSGQLIEICDKLDALARGLAEHAAADAGSGAGPAQRSA